MNRLKGKYILIGKDPNMSRLLVCVNLNGKIYTAPVGQIGNVPNSVSRCKPSEQVAHCKIDFDMSGSMILTNLKSQNVTYVDGIEIMSKRIDKNNTVALGRDRYTIDINAVLASVLKIVDSVIPPPPVEYSISHLEAVWMRYERTIEGIQHRQIERGRRRMLPIMFGSMSGLAAPLFATLVSASTLYVTVPIAAISFLMYIINYREKDTSIEEKKAANDQLIEHYSCPNPDCKHFFGFQSYKVLKQNKRCPYCGCHLKS